MTDRGGADDYDDDAVELSPRGSAGSDELEGDDAAPGTYDEWELNLWRFGGPQTGLFSFPVGVYAAACLAAAASPAFSARFYAGGQAALDAVAILALYAPFAWAASVDVNGSLRSWRQWAAALFTGAGVVAAAALLASGAGAHGADATIGVWLWALSAGGGAMQALRLAETSAMLRAASYVGAIPPPVDAYARGGLIMLAVQLLTGSAMLLVALTGAGGLAALAGTHAFLRASAAATSALCCAGTVAPMHAWALSRMRGGADPQPFGSL